MIPWLSAYLLTCTVEIPVILLLTRVLGWPVGFRRMAMIGWGLQSTHPVLWLVSPNTIGAILGAEAAVTLIEGMALGWWASRRPELVGHPVRCESMAMSTVANAASVLVGLVVARVV